MPALFLYPLGCPAFLCLSVFLRSLFVFPTSSSGMGSRPEKKKANSGFRSFYSSPMSLIKHDLRVTRTSHSEKAMAPHSSTLAWRIPWAKEPGRLQSMGSWRVGHDWVTSLSLFTFMHWRRKWHPTPVFLPGESQGWGSLVGCRLWGRTESDTIEVT